MNQSFKIIFLLKKGKGSVGESYPVYVRVTVDNKRVEWSVQRTWKQSRWNQKVGQALGNKEDARTLNAFLDAIKGSIYETQKEYILRKEKLTASLVRSLMRHSPEDKSYSLLEVYQFHNDQFEKLVGVEYSYRTLQKFRTCLKSVKAFLHYQFKREDVPLSYINHKFLTEYEFYLKTECKLHHNSAMVCMKKLKKIVRLCIANDWLNKDPFKSFKITSKETHRNFLLKDELEKLVGQKFDNERLERVKDIFLFSCYTGLAYSDVAELTQGDISIGIDGIQWIFTRRAKTDTSSRIPLLPIAYEIIQKYATDPQVLNTGLLLPIMSNQKINDYLKEVATICGFNKKLTFHCARHTFATTVTLTNDVPIETVSKMLGHKSIRTTQIYAKILDCKVSSDMQKLREKLGRVS